jgi:hypothetical protein
MLLPIAEKIIDQLKQTLEVKSDGQPAKYWCFPQAAGCPPALLESKKQRLSFFERLLTLNRLNPVHRQGDCPPILFHLACE